MRITGNKRMLPRISRFSKILMLVYSKLIFLFLSLHIQENCSTDRKQMILRVKTSRKCRMTIFDTRSRFRENQL